MMEKRRGRASKRGQECWAGGAGGLIPWVPSEPKLEEANRKREEPVRRPGGSSPCDADKEARVASKVGKGVARDDTREEGEVLWGLLELGERTLVPTLSRTGPLQGVEQKGHGLTEMLTASLQLLSGEHAGRGRGWRQGGPFGQESRWTRGWLWEEPQQWRRLGLWGRIQLCFEGNINAVGGKGGTQDRFLWAVVPEHPISVPSKEEPSPLCPLLSLILQGEGFRSLPCQLGL